jgi:hypothetical protein
MSKTDKELFRDFLNSKERGNDIDTVGTLYLTGHEYDGIDDALRDMANGVIVGGADPTQELDFALQQYRGVVHNLERLMKGFLAYKAAMEVAA